MTSVDDRLAGPTRWPDLHRVPPSRWRAKVAAALLRRVAARHRLDVVCPGAPPGADDRPRLILHRPEPFLRRLGVGGLIGFGESYQAGEWDSPDLVALLTRLAANAETLVPRPFHSLRRFHAAASPAAERNTPDGSLRNVSHHYDLSNELFAQFLDDTMTYSSAWFDGEPPSWDGLAAAQHRKIDRLLDALHVASGSRVLEIGTGWGELAIRAAARGAVVDSITLSRRQLGLARERIAAAGLSDRVTVRLRDYRELPDARRYDAVASVEMIEAVGHDYWPEYFGVLDRVLAEGGRVGLQAITMPHQRMRATRRTHTWIQKYIFPGGLIPSEEAVRRVAAGHTGLRVTDTFRFGPDYAETLRLWRERFDDRAAQVDRLGFDETFRRTWRLYLAYSEAGFRSGYLNVCQFVMERTGS
ncbi:cyclopropane-fatty-acyl-phospholipid synthase [Stackebrandtia albiflava]|uniref:Cyclopropane-fatty-acyl-phospholipid synthase n=1 Tax=Stackebrandtia albiflava TaxID=406432 RepID=A0A562VAR3_9ACTN|nr:cyclopropane-fatty-acyl-phospholipid synthase family protein [Stackebrandtia albiflava]TWJ14938.1 cyclopropane-fatty-acyl-phospholipid synthase [Stackebrandtia albiflava]